jgi:hypothetical protein
VAPPTSRWMYFRPPSWGHVKERGRRVG